MLSKQHTIDDFLRDGCGRCDKFQTPTCYVHPWAEVLKETRTFLTNHGLTEAIKWGQPCFTWNQKTVVLMSARQQFVSLSFFKGVLLKDPHSLLITQGEHSHIARIFNIDSTDHLQRHHQQLTSWIEESKLAITNNTPLPKRDQLAYPTELDTIFQTDHPYKEAFSKLTPGRQRGYLIHFSDGKKSSTRSSRIQKCRAKIMDGKGWNER